MKGARSGGAVRGLRLLLVAAAAGLAAVTASAAAGPADAAGYTTLSQGDGAAALPQYTPFGPTAADTPETVSFILRARNLGALEAQVQAGMPGGYLSVSDFAGRYGEPQSAISSIEAYLARFGIQSQAMPNGLDIQSTGTAGQYDAALQIDQKNYRVPALPAHGDKPGRPAMTVHGSPTNPKVPSSVGGPILAVLGLSNYPTQQSNMVGVPSNAQTQLPNTALLPKDFADRYDLAPVYQSDGTGAGRTIGIVTLASVRPDVVSQFWSRYAGLSGQQASASRITPVDVDGGAGAPSEALGSDETVLDAEQSGALAPDAAVRIYQAPNTDAGFVDAFFQAASDNVADSVSASWGESETIVKAVENAGLEDPNYAATFDEAFLELAAQGQSAFVSSGDEGAYPASRDLGSTNISAGNPDESPWITSSGGTTLPGSLTFFKSSGNPATTTIPAERTWGWDYLWPVLAAHYGGALSDWAESEVVGSGGGYSTLEPMPQYQRGVQGTRTFSAVPYLTPDGFVSAYGLSLPTTWDFDATPATIQGTGSGRVTPDLSTDADPETGYQVLYTFGDSSNPSAPPTIEQFGGTSFVAPQLNGTAAAIDSALGHRVGFWNPAIYRFATQKDSPFTPLDTPGTSNDNLYYSGTPGNTYNVGSGLGTPDLGKLAADFASSR